MIGSSAHEIKPVNGVYESIDQRWLDPKPGDGSYIESDGEGMQGEADWLIDVGPFFDRFGASKMAVLASTNATVKALVADISVRKWIDLKNAQVAAGIDALIALGLPGLDSNAKQQILSVKPTAEENRALRKLYF